MDFFLIALGHGSFGVIRKVKRKSDGHVRTSLAIDPKYPLLTLMCIDPLSKGNKLYQNVPQGA